MIGTFNSNRLTVTGRTYMTSRGKGGGAKCVTKRVG